MSLLQWILDALVVAAIGTFIGVFGYAAKLQRFLRTFLRCRPFLPRCPQHLKKTLNFSARDERDGFSPVGHR